MSLTRHLEREIDALRLVRDEIRLQLHLASADARSEWDRLEKRWDHLEGRVKVLRDASKDSLADIGAGAKLVLDEIQEGYQELRALL